ncbi:hypothetical protein [Okibacterium endophyticum]
MLTGCSSTSSATPIDYEPGELSGQEQDFATDMAACLKESGWEVEVRPDNSYTIQLQEEQSDAYDAAVEACSESLGYEEEPEPLTDAQMKRLYAGLVSLAGCLRDEGHEVRDVPSEQAFLDDAVFDPYGELRDPKRADALSDDDYYDLLQICPRP